MVRGSTV
jgi:hypothetical protein